MFLGTFGKKYVILGLAKQSRKVYDYHQCLILTFLILITFEALSIPAWIWLVKQFKKPQVKLEKPDTEEQTTLIKNTSPT